MSLNCIRRASSRKEGSAIDDKIRALIAAHFEVDISRVTDEAHFIEDLGADWLDRLELMIMIEDQFAGVEVEDSDLNQIEVVGDLIHYIEARIVRSGTGASELSENSTRCLVQLRGGTIA
jgi:acyl carrier protein